jgi:predicted  nucleic acid-binding Zn-ribbon protein
MAGTRVCLVTALSVLGQNHALQLQVNNEVSNQAQANPVRKVVTMLQKMVKKVEAEGEHEADLFAKYMCYCKNAGSTLGASISSNDAKVPATQSEIEKSEEQKVQLESDLEKARTGRAAAKDAMAEATSIREKEAAAFAKLKSEADANIAALGKAINSVDSGMAGFLQTTAASQLRKIVESVDSRLSDTDRQDLTSFLSGTQSAEYSPSSGEISGILKQINDEMKKDLADATATEEGSIKSFDELMSAKKKEVDALTAEIESKTIRSGEVAVLIVQLKNELSDAEAALIADKKFLADLDGNCAKQEKDYEVVKQTRQEELTALAETIKILNDDDALELFKKTLPGAASSSFVQIESQNRAVRSRALATLKAVSTTVGGGDRLNFIMMALRGKKVGFAKVLKMVDDMIGTLKKEQTDDNDKQEYCKVQLDNLDDKKKGLERDVSDSEKAIADAEESLETLKADIESLADAIKALDKSVVEQTEQRKEEHEEFTELVASDTAAKELLEFAKNRLQKFYNPALYVPPPKRELSREDRIAVNMGGTAPPTPAPGGIAGTGIALADVSVAPPPPPEAVGAYKKKGEESSGVIAMIDLLIKDLDKELTEAKTAEKDAQADFETAMTDAAKQRAMDTKTFADKEAAKADTEAQLQLHTDNKVSATSELMATMQVISQTHAECDWLLQYFDARKEARDSEIDALTKAKAVLNGADFSFLQVSATRAEAPEDELAKEMTHDLEMNFNKIAPFGKEDTAKELQDHAAKTQDTLVDAVENAEVAEIKRAVFRALTRLRAATIKEFDTIARLETQAIDAYNDAHHYRAENPLAHLHEDEAPVETDKLKSFH